MFTNKKLKTHKNRPVLGLNHCDADAASVTTNHRGVDVGSVYRNNTRKLLLTWRTAECTKNKNTSNSKVTKHTHFYRKWKPLSCLFTFGNKI